MSPSSARELSIRHTKILYKCTFITYARKTNQSSPHQSRGCIFKKQWTVSLKQFCSSPWIHPKVHPQDLFLSSFQNRWVYTSTHSRSSALIFSTFTIPPYQGRSSSYLNPCAYSTCSQRHPTNSSSSTVAVTHAFRSDIIKIFCSNDFLISTWTKRFSTILLQWFIPSMQPCHV